MKASVGQSVDEKEVPEPAPAAAAVNAVLLGGGAGGSGAALTQCHQPIVSALGALWECCEPIGPVVSPL